MTTLKYFTAAALICAALAAADPVANGPLRDTDAVIANIFMSDIGNVIGSVIAIGGFVLFIVVMWRWLASHGIYILPGFIYVRGWFRDRDPK